MAVSCSMLPLVLSDDKVQSRQSIANANKGSAPFRWIATTDLSLERLERLCSQNSGTGDQAQRAPQQKSRLWEEAAL